MRTIVAILNTPNKNGRIYTEESFYDQFPPKELYIVFGNEDPTSIEVPLDKVIGIAKDFLLEDNKLTCDIELFEEVPTSKIAKQYMEHNDTVFVINGTGSLYGQNVVTYKPNYIKVVDRFLCSFDFS